MSDLSRPDEPPERPEVVVSLAELWDRWRMPTATLPAQPSGDADSSAEGTSPAARRRRWWHRGGPKDEVAAARRAPTELLGPAAARWIGALAERAAVPAGWAVLPAGLDELLGQALPPRHDVSSLLRISDAATGEERCARAYDRVMHEPMSVELVKQLERAVQEAGEPIRLIPSLVTAAATDDEALRGLVPPLGPAADAASLIEALRRAWASLVLPSVVTVAARLGLREISMAVLLLPCSVADRAGIDVALASARSERQEKRQGDVAGSEPVRAAFVRLAPGTSASDDMSILSRSLLLPVLGAAAGDLGRRLGLPLSAVAAVVQGRDHALGLDVAALSPCLDRLPESLSRLVRSVVGAPPAVADGGPISTATTGSAPASTARPIRAHDSRASGVASDSTEPSALTEVARSADDVGPPASLRSAQIATSTAGAPATERASLLQRLRRARTAVAAADLVSDAVALMPSLAPSRILAIEAAVEPRLAALEQIDLGLLPTDALGTSVDQARSLLDDLLRLWLRQKSAELALQAFIAARVQARLPRSSPLIGVWLTELGRGCLAWELAEEIETAAGHVVEDDAAARVLASDAGAIDELPAGPARGCIQQIVAVFGDWCARPWELAEPRWREDPRELLELVHVAAERVRRDGVEAAPPASRRANAVASGRDELGRLEPELGPMERRLVRSALRRFDASSANRRAIDLALLRALWQCRRVALAMDRRLRRFDARVRSAAAFSATVDELRIALETESRDLGRLLRMRQAEREWTERRAANRRPYASSDAAPRTAGGCVDPSRSPGDAAEAEAEQHGEPLDRAHVDHRPDDEARPEPPSERRRGASASPGSCVARVRLADRGHPPTLEAGEVLVAFHVPAAWGAIVQRSAGVISEADGCLSGAAEVARAAALPMVGRLGGATEWLRTGDLVRVDGSRGLVERLG